MGDIAKVLSKIELESKPMFNNSVRIGVSEAVHLHWRDLRILMSPVQAESFFDGAVEAGRVWDGKLSVVDRVLKNTELNTDILFGDEAKVELLKDGNIHVHWRDLRLELTHDDFRELSCLLENALIELGGI